MKKYILLFSPLNVFAGGMSTPKNNELLLFFLIISSLLLIISNLSFIIKFTRHSLIKIARKLHLA